MDGLNKGFRSVPYGLNNLYFNFASQTCPYESKKKFWTLTNHIPYSHSIFSIAKSLRKHY